jgi:hypothetical protein
MRVNLIKKAKAVAAKAKEKAKELLARARNLVAHANTDAATAADNRMLLHIGVLRVSQVQGDEERPPAPGTVCEGVRSKKVMPYDWGKGFGGRK